MYADHFHLSHRPFDDTCDPLRYLQVAGPEAQRHRLRYGLEAGGPVVICGAPGSGKTILARRVAQDLGRRVIYLGFPLMSTAELVGFLCAELLGPEQRPPCVSDQLRGLWRVLSEFAREGGAPLLIVDDAHLVRDEPFFEALRCLLNGTTLGPPDLALLLVGDPELLLQVPPRLTDRLTARSILKPWSLDESTAFLQGRVQAANGPSDLFPTAVLASLHREADGLPRRLNRLADLALLIAYARGLLRPDVRCVELASAEAAFRDPLAA